MRQRPQYVLEAFARRGHPVYFVDFSEPETRTVGGVTIVPGLDAVPDRNVILYLHFAPLRDLFDRFAEAAIVYDILDDLSIYDADEVDMPEERRVRSHHPAVMERADVVIASNPLLADKHRAERADILLVPNGVDSEAFSRPVPPPADLRPDGRPVIGYHGMISHWFDFDLLEGVARRRPNWRFVLVGPHDPRTEPSVEGLRGLPNVELLGERPSDDMPAYVQAFDVGAVWFAVTDLTAAVTPLKVYEYLAAGIPAVSTPLPACVAEPFVETASSPETFVAVLEAALAEGDARAAARRRRAAESDWVALIGPLVERLRERGLAEV